MKHGLILVLSLLFAPLAMAAQSSEADISKAYFAGGCFWCTEADFEKLDGVVEAVSGYMGGHTTNPSYQQVSVGNTGHTEIVEIRYHPAQVSYEQLLTHFWHNVDPLTANAQFCDKGSQYRSAIFVSNAAERAAAEASKAQVAEELGQPVVTEINDRGPFYRAEEYHQDYYKKNALRYNYYRFACGRDNRLEEIWGQQAGS